MDIHGRNLSMNNMSVSVELPGKKYRKHFPHLVEVQFRKHQLGMLEGIDERRALLLKNIFERKNREH